MRSVVVGGHFGDKERQEEEAGDTGAEILFFYEYSTTCPADPLAHLDSTRCLCLRHAALLPRRLLDGALDRPREPTEQSTRGN